MSLEKYKYAIYTKIYPIEIVLWVLLTILMTIYGRQYNTLEHSRVWSHQVEHFGVSEREHLVFSWDTSTKLGSIFVEDFTRIVIYGNPKISFGT